MKTRTLEQLKAEGITREDAHLLSQSEFSELIRAEQEREEDERRQEAEMEQRMLHGCD